MRKSEKEWLEEYNALENPKETTTGANLYQWASKKRVMKNFVYSFCRSVGLGEAEMTLRQAKQEEILNKIENGEEVQSSDWEHAFGMTKSERKLLRIAGCLVGSLVGICIAKKSGKE